MEHSPAPVGTAHKKINPMAELPDMSTREQFWARDQEQEKVRISEERARRDKEQQEVESARLRREEVDRKVREEQQQRHAAVQIQDSGTSKFFEW